MPYWTEPLTSTLASAGSDETSLALPSTLFCFFLVGANWQWSRSRWQRLHGGSAGASTPDGNRVSYGSQLDRCVTYCLSHTVRIRQ